MAASGPGAGVVDGDGVGAGGGQLNVAPGSVVVVRDEEWLVTATETTEAQKLLLHVQGLSELVRDTTAMFYESLDDIRPVDPRRTRVVADGSSRFADTRLWLEANRRKTPVPLGDPRLTVSTRMLADALSYQEAAVRQALDPENVKPRILLADAVGLGKTIEIGMILSELVRRGRGERVLVVTPRHVLEQMQHEMWTRFALPFVRLDSVGIQKVRQNLPSTRNPFTFYKRAIISIDTLKNDRYIAALRAQRWDAVVIDEAHNLTNQATLNNRLARILARNTDALILASATPHNGRQESFAEIIRLLDPTAVTADNVINMEQARRLIIRRHRHSPEVARVVGAEWAEREEPQNILVPASAAESAVAAELSAVWLHCPGQPPSGGNSLFPWTLAKAFLSSPAALAESISHRLGRLADVSGAQADAERSALGVLQDLNAACVDASAKFDRLVDHLRHTVGVGPGSAKRAVVFAERVPTLLWLQRLLPQKLGVKPESVVVLHGGLGDEEQQRIVDSFKQAHSDIRVLVTGDVASEGVNLHAQCHHLVHYDIPWSLIRIEQRNGRIDRYGQRVSPQITTLLLDTGDERFSGDIRVLQALVNKEHEAHRILGEAGSLMGEYVESREEDMIRDVLMRKKSLDEVVATPDDVLHGDVDEVTKVLMQLGIDPAMLPPSQSHVGEGEQGPQSNSASLSGNNPAAGSGGVLNDALFATELDFVDSALARIYTNPTEPPKAHGGGVGWQKHPNHGTASFVPPRDFRTRLAVLPQAYVRDRAVHDQFVVATTKERGFASVQQALADQSSSSWPEAHFLGPLHPVLDWLSDNVMSKLDRSQVFAVQTAVDSPVVGLHGILTNKAGQVVSSVYLSAEFVALDGVTLNLDGCLTSVHGSLTELLERAMLAEDVSNPHPVAAAERLTHVMGPAIDAAEHAVERVVAASREDVLRRVERWTSRLDQWEADANVLVQRSELKSRRLSVRQEREVVEHMAPDRLLVRPLFVAVPVGFDVVAAGLPAVESEPVVASGVVREGGVA